MTRFERWLVRLGVVQVRRPWRFFALCGVVTAMACVLTNRLELRTGFDQLLPQDKPSVVELRLIASRTHANSKIFVLLEGDNRAALRAMGDALVPRLRAVGLPWVSAADDGVPEARAFLRPRAGMFASIEQLQKLQVDVDERWDREVSKKTGTWLGDDDASAPSHAEFAADVERRFLADGRGTFARDFEKQHPDGYFESPDGKAVLVVVRSTAQSGDIELARETKRRVEAVVEDVARDGRFAGVSVGFAGDLVTSLFEYGVVRDDLASVGGLGVGLVLGIIFLYFMRLRALVVMGATIVTGVAWTFGVTFLVIGHLNAATAFLFSIVAGNGINCGIIYMARYFEARRAGEGIERAVATAHLETWRPTLTAAIAAAASYGSLAVTEFRGFKHFALIGASGMLLCWVATYMLTPATLVLAERVRPFVADERGGILRRLRARGSPFEAPFVFLVPRAPRALAVVGIVTSIVGAVLVWTWVRSDPMEYDIRQMQTAPSTTNTNLYRVHVTSKAILGSRTDAGMVLLADRIDQVAPLARELEKKRAAAPPDEKPFETVFTLLDFVPDDQDAKLPILQAIADKLVRAHDRGLISDERWEKLAPYLPPEDLRPFDMVDLPDDIARPFTEIDGTRGRLVYVAPLVQKDADYLRYLLRWADSFRETRLPNGDVLMGSGRALIFADMLSAVISDVPIAMATSLGCTIAAVLITFRRRGAPWVLGALAVGVAWTGAYLAVTSLKINFLNFLALPITFGIGADYAVNVMQRYDTTGDAASALERVGGAVVLCSLTTMLGYFALVGSTNEAIRSLGMVAVFGEIACLLAAMIVLPAALSCWKTIKSNRA